MEPLISAELAEQAVAELAVKINPRMDNLAPQTPAAAVVAAVATRTRENTEVEAMEAQAVPASSF